MKKTALQEVGEVWEKYQQLIRKPPHPSPGKPKKYPEGTTKKTYCLPTHKFEEADRAIRKLLEQF